MRRPGKWRESDLRRAIKVATAAGLPIGGVEIALDGTVRLVIGDAVPLVPEKPNPWDAYARGEPLSTSGHNPWDDLLPGLTGLTLQAAEDAQAHADIERYRAERPRRKAQRLVEAREVMRKAAAKLDLEALDRLYEGYPHRSTITIARALGVSKFKLDLVAEVGLLIRNPDSHAVVYTKQAVLDALSVPAAPSSGR